MDLRFQRFMDRWALIGPCAILSAWHDFLSRVGIGRSVPGRSPKRILVILLSEMGSLVLAEPMFRRLRERHADADLYLMCFARNRALSDLLRLVPEDHVLAVRDSSLGALLVDLLRAIWQMRSLRMDWVIDCELFARVSAVLSGVSGAPGRAGFHRHTQEGLYRGSFLTAPVPYNPYRHISHQFISLADALESSAMPRSKFAAAPVAATFEPPVWKPDAGEVERETELLEQAHPTLNGKRLVLVNPSGGLLAIRAWPLEHYAAVARGLLDDGCAVGVVGMRGDHALGEELRRLCGGHANCVNLAGHTRSVRHLMAIFHRASLLITNDGGPGHFAAMTPMPTITFFGPESPALYGSWSPRAHSYFLGLPCSPCLSAYNHRNSPCDGDNQCLKKILPDEVLQRARGMIHAAAVEASR